MKKILLTALAGLLLVACSQNVPAKDIDILTLFSSESNSADKIWVGTFQLVFNDMKNNLFKREIEFVNEEPTQELIGLNAEEFNKSMLNDSSYYTSFGPVSPSAKETVKKGIYEKFKETSAIIDKFDWSKVPGKFYAYAMLKKQFEFFEPFDKLEKASFNNSQKQYDFFGINDESKSILDKNVNVLFYNNENDYALQLLTTSGDIVFLYRTNSNENFKKQYDKMLKNSENYSGNKEFTSIDTLKVPNLKINSKREYPELCNKTIVGSKLFFSDAIETIELELDNKGGKVKSEAMLITKMNFIPPERNPQPRHFDFDKTFTMFLIDSGKTDPYLALRVDDLSKFQK